ncbi:MAG: amidohydrolase family protein [Planctomycetia bacterium]
MAGPVTDVHVHIQPREQIKPAVMEAFRKGCKDVAAAEACFDDPRALLAYMDAAGVDRMVLINYEAPDVMGFDKSTNDWVIRYCKAEPRRLLPCVGLNPRFTPDMRGEAQRLVGLGARLFKIHGPHMLVAPNDYQGPHPQLADLYRVASEARVPVMFHTGTSIFRGARIKFGDPLQLDDVGNDFPALDVLIAHGGRPLWTEEAWFLLRRFPRFHLDLSGIPPARIPEWFPRLEEIATRCCFGTDWPSPGIPPVRENLEAVRRLDLSPQALEAILSGTALRLFPER